MFFVFFFSRAYQNAEQNDLWEALTKQAHQDKVLATNVTVKQIMDTWTLQTGFPVVTVNRNYDQGGATLIQVYCIYNILVIDFSEKFLNGDTYRSNFLTHRNILDSSFKCKLF